MCVSHTEMHVFSLNSGRCFMRKRIELTLCTLAQLRFRTSTCVSGPAFTRACVPAPAKPNQRPQAVLSHGGVAMVTRRSITIRMPACFYSDDNGPIKKIQVIVAESGGKEPWQPSLLFEYTRVLVLFVLRASSGISFYTTSHCTKLT